MIFTLILTSVGLGGLGGGWDWVWVGWVEGWGVATDAAGRQERRYSREGERERERKREGGEEGQGGEIEGMGESNEKGQKERTHPVLLPWHRW